MSVARQVARTAGSEVRPPASEAERAAAQRLAAWLRARGDAAEARTRWVRPQVLAALGAGAGLGAAGSLLSVVSAPAGLALAALGTLVAALEAASLTSPVRLLFPARAVTDVVVEPAHAPALVVCAPFGSRRRGLVARVAVRGGWVAAAAAAVLAACAARAAGGEGLWLGALQLVPTIALLAAATLALDAGLAGWAAGEAAAPAIAVAVYDELAAQPPGGLAPGLLLFAAGHPRPHAALILEMRPGMRGVRAHPRLAPAAGRAADALGRPAPRRGGPRATILLGSEAEDPETVVDLALAVADAAAQAQTSSPPTTARTP